MGFYPAVLLLCLAGQFDVNGLLMLETRAGQAPLDADGVVRWGVVAVATPDLQGSYLSRTLDVRLDYAPRIFWREPNDLTSYRPLVLHVGNFIAAAQPVRRVRLTATVTASVGEADYTAISAILSTPGSVQAALPSIVDFFSLTSTAGVAVDLSRLSVLSTSVTFIHRRPIGATADYVSPDPSFVPFPRQTSVVVAPGLRITESRQDDLLLSTTASYGEYSGSSAGGYSGGYKILTVVPQVGLIRHVSPKYDLRLGAGIAYAHVVPALDTQSPVAPVAEVGLDMKLAHSGGASTRASTTARLDYFVDPVLGTAGPRAMFVFGLYSILNPDWLIGTEASYSTVFTGTRTLPGGGTADETSVSLSIPIRYRAGDHVSMEFGFRYADRAPSVEVKPLGFHQRQLWLYYTLMLSTKRPTSRSVQ